MIEFEARSLIDATPDVVWQFHERPDALELLSPPWAKPQLVSRSGKLEAGARVEMLVPLGPWKVRWVALHVAHEHGRSFVDEQVEGPFRYWRHEHRFESVAEGTMLVDWVKCQLPLSPVSDFLGGWVVKLQLRRMFAYRHGMTKRFCEAAR